MTSWRRINLLLAAYVALLAAVWLWPAGDDAPLPPLTDIDVAAVSTIRVERGNRLVMAFERQGSTWNMSYPHASPAVAQRVTRLLAIAQAPVWQHLPADAATQRFGLAAPTTTVQFDTTRIGFGDHEPSQRARYVAVDDAIAVIDDLYFNLTMLPPAHYLPTEPGR